MTTELDYAAAERKRGAAEEMYEALQQLIEDIEEGDKPRVEAAIAALRKADGHE